MDDTNSDIKNIDLELIRGVAESIIQYFSIGRTDRTNTFFPVCID